MKKILVLVLGLVLFAVPCFAEWSDTELDANAQITVGEMKKELKTLNKMVYVREAESEDVMAYVDTTKIPALAKMIALNLSPDQMTYVYTNNKKIYKDLASRLSYYAGRNYDFNGYRIISEKEGGKVVDGVEIYRLWVIKAERPKEVIVETPAYYYRRPSVVIDVWPWHHHHHHWGHGGHGHHHRR